MMKTAGNSDPPAEAAGIDAGASLAKLALRLADGEVEFSLLPAEQREAVVAAVRASGAERVGLTGGGAAALARALPGAQLVNEFAAWGSGASHLLEQAGEVEPGEPHLLVSLGTGTSVMLADGMAVNRIGGTALGGGTLVGLGAALVASGDFETLAGLARHGSRHRVDLLVSDIYRAGEIALAGDLTAANFGKLGRAGEAGPPPTREDLAHALMGLVGENVALICAGLATSHRVRRVVFGGTTLRGNPALVDVLRGITTALGCTACFLPHGEYAGALGALRLAEARPAANRLG